GLAPFSASPFRGSDADPSLVRPAEGSLRAVADLSGDLGKALRCAGEQLRGELHAPLGQVLHRGNADEMGEALREHGARQSDLPRELVQAPAVRGTEVELPESAADVVVAEAGEPADFLRRQGGQVAPHDLDEQELAETREDDLASSALRHRFGERELHEMLERAVV